MGEPAHGPSYADLKHQIADLTAKLETARYDVHAFVTGKDKLGLVCGAKEPCELKDDPNSPCTFGPTPMELYKRCQELTTKLKHSENMLEHYRTEFEQTRSALLAVQSAMIRDNADLTRRLEEAQGLVTKMQDLATTRGEAIATLTERWAERRRFYKTKYREARKQRDAIQVKLEEAQQRAKELEGILASNWATTCVGIERQYIAKLEAMQARLAKLEGLMETVDKHFDVMAGDGQGMPFQTFLTQTMLVREQIKAALLAGKGEDNAHT